MYGDLVRVARGTSFVIHVAIIVGVSPLAAEERMCTGDRLLPAARGGVTNADPG